MSKVALAMIVRGNNHEPENLKRALSSAECFDKIFVTCTGNEEETKLIKQSVKEFKNVELSFKQFQFVSDQKEVSWLEKFFGYKPFTKVGDSMFLFDEARNFNFSQVPKEYEWIMWMDTDDVLRGGENLKAVVEKMNREKIECVYLNYLYDVEMEGDKIKNVIIEHIRERLVRNNGAFKWVSPIHETLIEQRPTSKTDNYNMDILHLAPREDREKSLLRNLNNLELAIYKTEGKDPRHLYYYAKALFDNRTTEDDLHALTLLHLYRHGPNPSGWPEERAQSCEYEAEILRRQGKIDESIPVLMEGLVDSPQNPAMFLSLGLSYAQKKDWERALFWVKMASAVEQKKSTLVTNPKDLQGRTLEIIYNACLNLGQIDKAIAAAVKLKELYPTDQYVDNAFNFINLIRQERDITKSIIEMADYLKKTGERHKIKTLLASVPAAFEKNPYIVDLNMKNNPPKFWGKDEIALFCGPGFTNWSPKTLSNPGQNFVGGSEEAVILMSRELAKLGWKVTVYGDPGTDEGVYDGVRWLPYFKFNRQDKFNIIIVWRQLGFFDMTDIKYNKAFLWLHDIQSPLEYKKERVDRIDKVFFLSKWHRDNVPALPEDKVFITSNGI